MNNFYNTSRSQNALYNILTQSLGVGVIKYYPLFCRRENWGLGSVICLSANSGTGLQTSVKDRLVIISTFSSDLLFCLHKMTFVRKQIYPGLVTLAPSTRWINLVGHQEEPVLSMFREWAQSFIQQTDLAVPGTDHAHSCRRTTPCAGGSCTWNVPL